MEPVAGCLACDLLVGVRPLPGGRLAESAGWVVEHSVGPLGLGTLVVKPVRHVVHVAALTDAESEALGPLLRRVAAAVTEVVRPEQVYVCLWSHADGVPGHLHFVVQPVVKADMARHDAFGPALQMAMFREGTVPNAGEVDALCERLRPALSGSVGGA
jgi:diadenosine tetraphosphate (Ap4A) HIT family hydrolase